MKKILVYLFAVMMTTIAFTGCKSNEPDDKTSNDLNGTTWVAKPTSINVATFVFSSSTFTLSESNIALSESVLLKGKYTKSGNSVTLNFTSATDEEVDLSALETTATIIGNTLVYGGISFTKQ